MELSPFALCIKSYLESLSQSDESLNRCLVKTDKAYAMCESWITEFVKKGIQNKVGCQIGFLSDEQCYKMMKEFFLDGVYALKIAEEKEKQQQEVEKRCRAEENSKTEVFSSDEFDFQKIKHLKQQDLFDFS